LDLFHTFEYNPLTVYIMKGIIILSNEDLQRCPDAEDTLIPFCEYIEQDDENSFFHSKEGTLMTMICVLLDKEIKYTLGFNNLMTSSNGKQSVKITAKRSNNITQR
jgi:hypothetical protein